MSDYYDRVSYGGRNVNYYNEVGSPSRGLMECCGYYDPPVHISYRGEGRRPKLTTNNRERDPSTSVLNQPEPVSLTQYLERGVGAEGPLNPQNLRFKFEEQPNATQAAVIAEVVGHKGIVINPREYTVAILSEDRGLDPDKEALVIEELTEGREHEPANEVTEHIPRLVERAIEIWGPQSPQGFNPENLSKALTNLKKTRERFDIQIPAPAQVA